MQHVVVIGSQWGDEGKGKIVDWLCAEAEIVVRFQGGHNAGHTLVVNGVEHRLHLLPSGVIRPGILSVIGGGTVVEPWKLLAEIDNLRQRGVHISPDTLWIADNASMILPHYAILDSLRETALTDGGSQAIGTTRRGIGVAYEDKIGRRALRICDLREPSYLAQRVKGIVANHDPIVRSLGGDPLHADQIVQSLLTEVAPRLLPHVRPCWNELWSMSHQRKRILFEGAQGVMLDVDHGTYPFVTSSNTVGAQAAIGSGVGLARKAYVLGITKCYTTRVGEGPFPTEQKNDIGERLGSMGKEFGTTTGRKRRCGWFDATLVRQSCAIGGIDGLALTKLDVLDTLDTIRIAVGYHLDGAVINYIPSNAAQRERLEPIYEDMDGWKVSTRGARLWRDLPAEAIKYIRRIEELVQTPVAIVSTSPERQDTITVKNPFGL